MKRKAGFYWVKIKDTRWVVSEWDGTYWYWQGVAYPDQAWEFIDEDRLLNHSERDT